MEIDRNVFFKIIKQNFNYVIVNTSFGDAIKMSPKDAFIYSCITGAGYLDNPIYPFTPKGLHKLFYNAFDYKFVTGIFDNLVLKHTPYILSQAKPFLFQGDKFIVPIEFNRERDLQKELKSKFDTIKNPLDFIIQRIETSKRGNGMEPFLEFLTAEYFKNKGYIVETQIPLAHSIGSPDFGGYGLKESIEQINAFTSLKGGFHLIELALLRINNDISICKDIIANELIVGEAKTGPSNMLKQLKKYLDTALFDKGFEIYPSKKQASKTYLGLVSIDDDYKIVVKNPKDKYKSQKGLSRQDYIRWLNNYIKFYLIANITNDELNNYYREHKCQISTPNDIVEFVSNLSIVEIINKVKEIA